MPLVLKAQRSPYPATREGWETNKMGTWKSLRVLIEA